MALHHPYYPEDPDAPALQEQAEADVRVWLSVPLLYEFLQNIVRPEGPETWARAGWPGIRKSYLPFSSSQHWSDWIDFTYGAYCASANSPTGQMEYGETSRESIYSDLGARFARMVGMLTPDDNVPIEG